MTCETAKTQDHQFLVVPPANFQPSKFWLGSAAFFCQKRWIFSKKSAFARALFNFFTSKLTYLCSFMKLCSLDHFYFISKFS